jgi:hypothetical protein
MLRALTKYCDIGREHRHSVANSHCGDPASKCIHPRFTAICQYQYKVWAVDGDDEARYARASSDIHNGAGNASEGINKLP